LTDKVNYTLVMIGPNNLSTPLMNLQTGTQYTRELTKTNNTHYMRWFNWG